MKLSISKTSKRVSAGLLASTIALSAFALSPDYSDSNTSRLGMNSALADAVKVQAPKAPGFADVVEAVSPAVVSVRVEQMVQPASNESEFRFDRRHHDDLDRLPDFFRNNPKFFERFFDRPDRRRDSKRRHAPRRFGQSQGSGFFISEDGYVVTNNHVIDGGSKYTIVMNDGTELEARLIGADKRSDLAVLKVDTNRKFTYVALAEDRPRIGDWVVAVGNPFGLGGTVTAGIVSAHGREIGSSRYDDFIQIDAAVNKGNSGGPAFNLNGEVIGVNTAIFSPSGGNVGIAFAIPASTTQEIVDELIKNGSVVRGWLGVQIQPVTKEIAEALALEDAGGAMVTEPQEGGPADKAGIRPGDVIVKVDEKPVRGPKALARVIGEYDPNSEVELTVVRTGEEMEINVTLGNLGEVASLDTSPEPAKPKADRLGLALGPSPDGDGVLVLQVAPESSADIKGVRSGDVVASVNGEKVSAPQDVAKLVDQAEEAGRKSTLLQIKREGRSSFIAVPLNRS